MNMKNGKQLLNTCEERNMSIAEAMLWREMQTSERSAEDILAELMQDLNIMKDACARGLSGMERTRSGLSGGDAVLLNAYENPYLGEAAAKAAAAAMAVAEVNAAMGRIIAAPTAGACGILPGVLLTYANVRNWSDDALIDALLVAGAVGIIIAQGATISGADGGCQAETGTAAAMTAAALVFLSGGSAAESLDAAAIALKNVMGLACDPVAGLVECPCVKRNAMGAANAMLSSDMVLSGIKSNIPFDEVVHAMQNVGHMLPPALRETARGGVAMSPTGQRIKKELEKDNHE